MFKKLVFGNYLKIKNWKLKNFKRRVKNVRF
jgi:hypothetical protein